MNVKGVKIVLKIEKNEPDSSEIELLRPLPEELSKEKREVDEEVWKIFSSGSTVLTFSE